MRHFAKADAIGLRRVLTGLQVRNVRVVVRRYRRIRHRDRARVAAALARDLLQAMDRDTTRLSLNVRHALGSIDLHAYDVYVLAEPTHNEVSAAGAAPPADWNLELD